MHDQEAPLSGGRARRGRPNWRDGKAADVGRSYLTAQIADPPGACAILRLPQLPPTLMALLLLAQGSLDATGRRLAQLAFWLPALQLVFGGL